LLKRSYKALGFLGTTDVFDEFAQLLRQGQQNFVFIVNTLWRGRRGENLN